MRSSQAVVIALLYAIALSPPLPAQSANPTDVVVTGRITPHCIPLADNLLDAATLAAPRARWVRIEPKADAPGYKYVFMQGVPSASSLTSLGQWRRAGDVLSAYVFRQPDDGSPLCIGKRRPHPLPEDRDDDPNDVVVVTGKPNRPVTDAQLQQLIDSGPYLCHAMRLTINLATRGTTALLWMNAGFGATKEYYLNGSSGWTTIRLEDGPVGWWYPWTGFGIALNRGDVWIDKVRFEIIPDDQLTAAWRSAQTACRTHLSKKQRAAQGLS